MVELINFSLVLDGIKEGKLYRRKGWNGKGLLVRLEKGVDYIQPFFVIVNTETGVVNTWVPSVSDLLAEDWEEVI